MKVKVKYMKVRTLGLFPQFCLLPTKYLESMNGRIKNVESINIQFVIKCYLTDYSKNPREFLFIRSIWDKLTLRFIIAGTQYLILMYVQNMCICMYMYVVC